MHWKHKARLQRLFSALPGGESWNYLFQRYVTRSLPVDDPGFSFRARLALEMLDLVREDSPRPLQEGTFYEFGAGADLIGPVTFHAMGVERQVVVDRSALLRASLLLASLEKARRLGPQLGFSRVPRRAFPRSSRELLRVLRDELGIDYRAPVDARASGLAPGSVDVVTSNSTLEHVPPEEIMPLLGECRRILRPGGAMCMRVDYEDHYGYSDARVSPYNFLYYSDAAWAKFNPALHYQNRLRHSDYFGIFEKLGLEVLDARPLEAGPETLVQLDRRRLDARFRDREDDLTVRKCTFLLRSLDM